MKHITNDHLQHTKRKNKQQSIFPKKEKKTFFYRTIKNVQKGVDLFSAVVVVLFMLCLVFVFLKSAHAENINAVINQAIHHRDDILKKEMNTIQQLTVPTKRQASHRDQSFALDHPHIMHLLNDARAPARGTIHAAQNLKSPPHALIFVSLSMPDHVLNEIFIQASHYQLPVVIRGIYHGSFKNTLKRLFQLLNPLKAQGIKTGVLIDPLWFRTFQIKTVPAVVVQQGDCHAKGACNPTHYDAVYGNIPIERALEVIKDRGTLQKSAKTLLEGARDV